MSLYKQGYDKKDSFRVYFETNKMNTDGKKEYQHILSIFANMYDNFTPRDRRRLHTQPNYSVNA